MPAFPSFAIQACLDFAGVRSEDLDYVGSGWPPIAPVLRHDLKCMLTGTQPISYVNAASWLKLSAKFVSQGNGKKLFTRRFPGARTRFGFIDHHLAHAISAYAFSGFDEAAVLVLDGRGRGKLRPSGTVAADG